MRTRNTLLAVIAANLTLLTLIQLEVWPTKMMASDTSVNYTPQFIQESTEIKLSEEQLNELKAAVSECDEDRIISRILFCLDGSSIEDGTLTTYCNR